MDDTKIKEQVNSILMEVLNHENFTIHEKLLASDVEGWDSLTHMVIITEIEKKFGIRFKLKELSKLDNLGSLLGLIAEKYNEK